MRKMALGRLKEHVNSTKLQKLMDKYLSCSKATLETEQCTTVVCLTLGTPAWLVNGAILKTVARVSLPSIVQIIWKPNWIWLMKLQETPSSSKYSLIMVKSFQVKDLPFNLLLNQSSMWIRLSSNISYYTKMFRVYVTKMMSISKVGFKPHKTRKIMMAL